MPVRKFSSGDASFERSPGQSADIFAANVIDERDGGPITIGYGRYGPNQSLQAQIAVHDVMLVLEGQVSVTTATVTVHAGPGDIVYMPKDESVHIQSHEQGALTAYVTYPHWKTAEGAG